MLIKIKRKQFYYIMHPLMYVYEQTSGITRRENDRKGQELASSSHNQKEKRHTHRSHHLTYKHHWSFSAARATREDPLAIELQEELGAGVDVNPSSVLSKWERREAEVSV